VSVVDSHCHLADEAFANDLSAVAARANAAGVTTALCILSADEPDELARARGVREAWPTVVFATGVHPHRAAPYAGRALQAGVAVDAALDQVSGVALGEIGLDYHYDLAPRDVQRDVFAAQLSSAGRRNLPVVIHTREATEDTVTLLRNAVPRVRGVMHCFTGTIEEARLALDLGFYLSFSGILTFPRATSLRAVAAWAPLDRILVETDAPYLAPVPHRGQRNEPAWVTETVRVLATARHIDEVTLVDALSRNFQELVRATPSAR